MFESAKWISKKSALKIDRPLGTPNPYFIKDIVIEKQVEKAILNVSGQGQAAYFIDGDRIPDSFRPTYPSEYKKTVIYNTYDVTNQMSIGGHRFGILLSNLRIVFESPGIMTFFLC